MDAWIARTGHPRGAVVSFERMWALVQPWYAGRMESGWRGRSPAEARAILESVGLRGAFWRMG